MRLAVNIDHVATVRQARRIAEGLPGAGQPDPAKTAVWWYGFYAFAGASVLFKELFLGGELSPTFFGSAVTNFGVELFLSRFLEMAPAPTPRRAHPQRSAAGARAATWPARRTRARLRARTRVRTVSRWTTTTGPEKGRPSKT